MVGKEGHLKRKVRLKAFIFYVISVVSAVFAMKTKENAFTLPVVIFLYEFLFFGGAVKSKILRLIPLLVTIFIIPLTLIGINKPVGQIVSQMQDPASLGYQHISRGDYLFTQLRVIVTYIRLIFLPINQNLDYSYPIYRSLFAPPVFLSFLFLLSIIATGLYLFHLSRSGMVQSTNDKVQDESVPYATCSESYVYYRLIGFGIIWFFITLSVESSVIPIPMIICEYRIYLPSVGAFPAIITASYLLMKKFVDRITRMQKIGVATLVLITLALSGATYARNRLWMNNITLWEDVVKKNPDNARPHNNLGVAYSKQNLIDEAIKEYQTAIVLKPDYADPHNSLGNAFSKKGWTDKAIEQYQLALSLKPDYASAHNNLGNAFFKKGWIDRAIEQYQVAIRLNPTSPTFLSNLDMVKRKKQSR